MKTFLHYTLVIVYSTLALCALSCAQMHAQTTEASFTRREVPVLTLAKNNAVLEIRLDNKVADKVEKIAVNFDGTTSLDDIESVSILYEGRDKKQRPFGKERPPAPGEMIFEGRQAVGNSTGAFKLNIRLKPSAGLLNRVNASCAWLQAGGKRIAGAAMPAPGLRIGVALRQGGDDGIARYRIPGLATTPKGTLLAIYDMRRVWRDLQGDITIGLSRSADGGQTWEPVRVVLEMGAWGGLPRKYNGVSDACILVDERSGAVYVAGLWMHGVLDENGRWVEGLTTTSTHWNHQWRSNASQAGFDVKQTCQFMLARSLDDGRRWSQPANVTRHFKKEQWLLFGPAPGRGITLRDGTLVFPTQGRDKTGRAFSNITWSDNGGKTWTVSEPAFGASASTTENQIAQLDDGSIMLNARHGRENETGRLIAVTRDLGRTWKEHPTSRKALIGPGCMAGLLRHEYTAPDGSPKSILLFSNPNSKTAREKMTLKVSFDNGETWPESHWILLNEEIRSAYSCLTSVDEKTIGILYESGRANLVFQQIPLSEILAR